MATYKGIKGFTIQTIAGDPPAPIEGQVWYNTTSNKLKGYAPVTGAWASGGTMVSPNYQMAGAGIQTAALMMGGHTGGTQGINTVQSYDGASWTAANSLNQTCYQSGGLGIQSAALRVGGSGAPSPTANLASVESYDGTCWTEINDINSARQTLGAAGTQTGGLIFGGEPKPSAGALCETWNGTSWTEVGDLTTATSQMGGFGATNTAALSAGGSPYTPNTMKWDGTSWTEVNNLNTGRRGVQGSGSSTAGLLFGGWTSPDADIANTESYDGTSWTNVANLGASKAWGGAGTYAPNSKSISFGGMTPAILNTTEEWTSGVSVVTFTSS